MKSISKKLICMLMAVIMMASFVACSSEGATKPVSESESGKNDAKLEAFIENEGQAFIDAFTKSFTQTSDGMKCDTTIEVEGSTLVIDCAVEGMNNISDDVKAQLQDLYDQTGDIIKESFQPIKDAVPSLEAVIFNMREEDGDLLAGVRAEY